VSGSSDGALPRLTEVSNRFTGAHCRFAEASYRFAGGFYRITVNVMGMEIQTGTGWSLL
jgi:hypothetical protein